MPRKTVPLHERAHRIEKTARSLQNHLAAFQGSSGKRAKDALAAAKRIQKELDAIFLELEYSQRE